MLTEQQLLMLIARYETQTGPVNWYRLRHWDQEIPISPNATLRALAAKGWLEAVPERAEGWYRLTAEGWNVVEKVNENS